MAHTIEVPGYSILLSTNISNVGGMFVILKPFEERAGDPDLGAPAVMARLRQAVRRPEFRKAGVAVFGAPPVDGLGSTGGFKLQVQDRGEPACRRCRGGVRILADAGQRRPAAGGLFTSFSVTQPQLYVDGGRGEGQDAAGRAGGHRPPAGLPRLVLRQRLLLPDRNWQVNVQAGAALPQRGKDIGKLEVRNAKGDRVPLRTLIKVRLRQRPGHRQPLQLYPSAEINGSTAPGAQSGQAISIMDDCSKDDLPLGDGLRVDRADLPADPGRARTCSPSWSSRWPWCSCSWCWRRSTRAGRCRWRSS